MTEGKLYTVTGITERIGRNGPGEFAMQVVISFTTKSGYKGTVTLPQEGLTPKKAEEALTREATKYETIYSL